jgi:nucleoside-diphosphate-sugar epimerase
MIIGNGLVAKGFAVYQKKENVIIFASGVSNSKEQRKKEFEREFNLLKNLKVDNETLVYFSTCSIFDETIKNTPYVLHKKEIENYISKKFKNYIIFRLPTLLGKTSNPNTLFNFFYNKIKSGQNIPIYKNAYRYLIDIDDISKLLPQIIDDKKNWRKKINVVFKKPISTLNIIKVIMKELNLSANLELFDLGEKFVIDNKDFIQLIDPNKYRIESDYNSNVLKKYCRMLL